MDENFQILYGWFLRDDMKVWIKGQEIWGSWICCGERMDEGEIAVRWPGMRPMLYKAVVDRKKR